MIYDAIAKYAEKYFNDECAVFEHIKSKDENGATLFERKEKVAKYKCRITEISAAPAESDEYASTAYARLKVMLPRDAEIEPECEIELSDGRRLICCGYIKKYATHKEAIFKASERD